MIGCEEEMMTSAQVAAMLVTTTNNSQSFLGTHSLSNSNIPVYKVIVKLQLYLLHYINTPQFKSHWKVLNQVTRSL